MTNNGGMQDCDVQRNLEVVAMPTQSLQDFFRDEDRATITSVELRQTAVQCLGKRVYKDKPKPPGKLFMHFWVIMTTECAKTLSMEMVNRGTPCFGGEMYSHITEGPGPANSTSRAKIALEGVSVTIAELQEKINERGKVKYDLLCHNCWEFASGLAMDIVDLCLSDAAHPSDCDKASLVNGKKRLEEVERPLPSDCIRLLCTWWHINDARNVATTQKLKRRFTGNGNILCKILNGILSRRDRWFQEPGQV